MIDQFQTRFNAKAFHADKFPQEMSPPFLHGTTCCAMCVLSLKNYHTKEEIKEVVDHVKNDSLTRDFSPAERHFGERNVVVITVMPNEKELESNLKKVGFKLTAKNLSRRNGYPKSNKLNMWMYSF